MLTEILHINNLSYFLLAEHSRLDAMSDGFRTHTDPGRDNLLIGLLILATVGAGAWAAARLLTRRVNGQLYDNPWRLFYDLCKVHKLSWSERSQLQRLAKHQGMKDPARIFLEAERWEPNRIPAGIRHEYNRLNALRARLFETPPSEILGDRPSAGKLPISKEWRPPSTQAATLPDRRKPESAAAMQSTARSIAPEPASRPLPLVTPRSASPLLPPLSSPTLDLPPWTVGK